MVGADAPPAFAMRTSTVPCVAIAASSASERAIAFVISATTLCTPPGISAHSAATWSKPGSDKSCARTVSPNETKRLTSLRPIPPAAPVIKTIRAILSRFLERRVLKQFVLIHLFKSKSRSQELQEFRMQISVAGSARPRNKVGYLARGPWQGVKRKSLSTLRLSGQSRVCGEIPSYKRQSYESRVLQSLLQRLLFPCLNSGRVVRGEELREFLLPARYRLDADYPRHRQLLWKPLVHKRGFPGSRRRSPVLRGRFLP